LPTNRIYSTGIGGDIGDQRFVETVEIDYGAMGVEILFI